MNKRSHFGTRTRRSQERTRARNAGRSPSRHSFVVEQLHRVVVEKDIQSAWPMHSNRKFKLYVGSPTRTGDQFKRCRHLVGSGAQPVKVLPHRCDQARCRHNRHVKRRQQADGAPGDLSGKVGGAKCQSVNMSSWPKSPVAKDGVCWERLRAAQGT